MKREAEGAKGQTGAGSQLDRPSSRRVMLGFNSKVRLLLLGR